MAESNFPIITKLNSWFLDDRETLQFNDLDGRGNDLFWIVLDEKYIAVLSFGWAVLPGQVPHAEKAILIKDGKISDIKPEVDYDFKSLKGSISTPSRKYIINTKESAMKTVRLFNNAGERDFSELKILINKTPIKISAKPIL